MFCFPTLDAFWAFSKIWVSNGSGICLFTFLVYSPIFLHWYCSHRGGRKRSHMVFLQTFVTAVITTSQIFVQDSTHFRMTWSETKRKILRISVRTKIQYDHNWTQLCIYILISEKKIVSIPFSIWNIPEFIRYMSTILPGVQLVLTECQEIHQPLSCLLILQLPQKGYSQKLFEIFMSISTKINTLP